ncbi:MAG: DNA double-strand break repair nuclease NurA, partial [Candidatus Altiarchaeota archaeon]|nr:DNA double-strand break repair nuclease NurA [Candidatus Altiarchaeota archaeon]
ISRVGEIARSFAEWSYASFVIKQLRAGDVFARDGTLHAPYTNQTKYAEEAYKTAEARDVDFVGISKTCSLYTSTGLPLVAAIARLARENGISGSWYYEKVADITDPAHKADLNFVKLNDSSKYILRTEVLKGQETQKERIFGVLASNARDISFPGYPYGLVDADKNARVSYRELKPLRMLISSEISKTENIEGFKEALMAADAHDWLNKIV